MITNDRKPYVEIANITKDIYAINKSVLRKNEIQRDAK